MKNKNFNLDNYKKMVHCHSCETLSNSYLSNVNAIVELSADGDKYIEGSIVIEEYHNDYCNYCKEDIHTESTEYVYIPTELCKGLEGTKLNVDYVIINEEFKNIRTIKKKDLAKILLNDN